MALLLGDLYQDLVTTVVTVSRPSVSIPRQYAENEIVPYM